MMHRDFITKKSGELTDTQYDKPTNLNYMPKFADKNFLS